MKPGIMGRPAWVLPMSLIFCLLAAAPTLSAPSDLIKAAEVGDLIRVKALLAAQYDVNAKLDNGFTALMVAAGMGHIQVVQTLLAAKADVDAKALPGVTALIYASQEGRLDVVHTLLAAGADVNSRAILGTTALFMAAQKGHAEVVKVLLEAGADANARTERGLTAAMIASQQGHPDVAQILMMASPPVVSTPANPAVSAGCSAILDVHLETFGEGVSIELRQGVPGNSRVIDNQKSSGGTVYFARLCQGPYFMAIGNEDAVEVTPVRHFEDHVHYHSNIVVQRGSGNITRKSRRNL